VVACPRCGFEPDETDQATTTTSRTPSGLGWPQVREAGRPAPVRVIDLTGAATAASKTPAHADAHTEG
jgi:hypothetical protein